MANMIPCKVCLKNFDYVPGVAGNARQICATCMSTVDEAELVRLEEKTIIDGNRYLLDAPNRKSEYDPLDILVDGNIPELKSDADRFVCTMEMAAFVKKSGLTGMEKNIANFLMSLPGLYFVLFVRHQDLEMMESMAKNIHFKPFVKEIMKVAI